MKALSSMPLVHLFQPPPALSVQKCQVFPVIHPTIPWNALPRDILFIKNIYFEIILNSHRSYFHQMFLLVVQSLTSFISQLKCRILRESFFNCSKITPHSSLCPLPLLFISLSHFSISDTILYIYTHMFICMYMHLCVYCHLPTRAEEFTSKLQDPGSVPRISQVLNQHLINQLT